MKSEPMVLWAVKAVGKYYNEIVYDDGICVYETKTAARTAAKEYNELRRHVGDAGWTYRVVKMVEEMK